MGFFGGYKAEPFSSNVFKYSENNVVNGKKLKETYDLKGLCHAWASGNVPRGRSGASMFFENGIIYSYGYHFPIAKIHTNKKGEKMALITSEKFTVTSERSGRETVSQSTEGHKLEVRSSVKHLKTISVTYPLLNDHWNHADNIRHLSNEMADVAENILLMRGWNYNSIAHIEGLYEDLKEYCKFFGLKVPFELSKFSLEVLKESDKAHDIKTEARRKKLEETKKIKDQELKEKCSVQLKALSENFPNVLTRWENGQASDNELKAASEMRVTTPGPFGRDRSNYFSVDLDQYSARIETVIKARFEKSLNEWRNGKERYLVGYFSIGSLSFDFRPEHALLRVKGNKVETSEGADVPLDHALRLLNIIERGEARKGERIGHYTLLSVSDLKTEPVLIKIGCHTIELSEARQVLEPFKNTDLKLIKE